MDTQSDAQVTGETNHSNDEQTTVEVRCTGHVRNAVGRPHLTYTFAGATLREFLAAFFDDYDVEDMLIAETEADATTRGWAKTPTELPGTWRKNPTGEQTRAYARVSINGTFNEHIDGLDTRLEDGDRVSLMYPFIYCC
ncbi:pterin cluster protein [Haladaptatus sp. NG-SE-30]